MTPGGSRLHADRELIVTLGLACLLVVARSVVFVAYEQANFDSDQAIVGLMAKHLSEGRAFPLFFYGQTYLLGVEAWLAVPWFWALGPTVAALKLSLLASNLALGVLLVLALVRDVGLRPIVALVPAAFVLLAPPLISARLMEAMGGNVEPLLFVVVLWWLRARPLWFGAVLGVAFLNREFVAYAVPVLVAGDVLGRRRPAEVVRHWALVAVAFAIVWDGVQVLTPLADIMGPGSRGTWVQTGSQIGNLAQRMNVEPTAWPGRIASAAANVLPDLVGGRALDDPLAPQGHGWIGWLVAALIAGVTIRLAWLARRRDRPAAPFAWYLAGVGLVAVAAFVVTRPVDNAPLRYVLLAAFVPVGLTAAWLRWEPLPLARRVGLAAVVVWAAVTGADHWHQASRYVLGHQPDPMGQLASALVQANVRVAETGYWRAYRLTFLTRERVILASTDVVRIAEYQERARQAGAALRVLQETACAGGEPIGGWWLCEE